MLKLESVNLLATVESILVFIRNRSISGELEQVLIQTKKLCLA